MDGHCKGILIAVSAVLSGSVCAVPIRMLGHSNVFTQSLMRSGPCLFTLLVLAAALWGGRTPAKIKSLGWIGVCGCVFLVSQDLAITAGFLLTKVSNVCVCPHRASRHHGRITDWPAAVVSSVSLTR